MPSYVFGRIRGERFTTEETEILIREVRSRQKTIYGDKVSAPRLAEVKKAWEEVAAAVNRVRSGPVRTPVQCRKRFNDMKRLGRRPVKMTLDMPTVSQSATPTPDPAASAPPPELREGTERPGSGSAVSQQEPAKENQTESSGRSDPTPPAAVSPLRTRSGQARRQAEQDSSRFDALHRELVVLRRSVGRMENRTLPLLWSISKSLERIADTLDYISAPGTDELSESGFMNNTDI